MDNVFVPNRVEILGLLQKHCHSHFLIPDNQWVYEGENKKQTLKRRGSTVYELEKIVDDKVSLRVVASGEVMPLSLPDILFMSQLVDEQGRPRTPTPINQQKRLVIPVDVSANIRAHEYARIVRKLCGDCNDSYVATLDGRLRNALHLVHAGIAAHSIIVVELNPLVAFYQCLLKFGTELEAVNVIHADAHRVFINKTPITVNGLATPGDQVGATLIAMNLDFCGSVPSWVTSTFIRRFPSVRLWGFTAGTRNNTRARHAYKTPAENNPKDYMIPEFDELELCKRYDHGQAISKFFVRSEADCVPELGEEYTEYTGLREIFGRWTAASTPLSPSRTYFLVLIESKRAPDGVIARWFEDVEMMDDANLLLDEWGRRERTHYHTKKTLRDTILILPTKSMRLPKNHQQRLVEDADVHYAAEARAIACSLK